jgi:3-isopropylmalate/(R)-2-methylmalate dehydratase small subunit
VAGRNFGCGSSREHAVWALDNYGFRAVIAPSFADIFHNNCFSNGLLPITLPEETVRDLHGRIAGEEGYTLTINLEEGTVSGSDGFTTPFEIDPFYRYRLLHGLDDIGLTMRHGDAIRAYEAAQPSWKDTRLKETA